MVYLKKNDFEKIEFLSFTLFHVRFKDIPFKQCRNLFLQILFSAGNLIMHSLIVNIGPFFLKHDFFHILHY